MGRESGADGVAEPKYDVAFSFLNEHHGLAKELCDSLLLLLLPL
jgi:hypothetical protein